MKVVILAGGFGTRLSEYTGLIPKPMVSIGGKPILWHIMKTYASFGYKDFGIALGYKAEMIKEYFLQYHALNSNFTVNLSNGEIQPHEADVVDWNVTLIHTGDDSMTGGRLKRMKSFIGDETFLLTYGDGVSDVNIRALVDFHKKNKKLITVTAVRPSARFGELKIREDSLVTDFQEKPQLHQGWINGGYFVVEPEFLDFIENDQTVLEREPIERACSIGGLVAYKHDGFWQCMDTKRDHDTLEKLWNDGAPWIV